MPTLKRFGKWTVRVYGPNDHNPPHFHIVGPDADLQVDARTLDVIHGDGEGVPAELWEWVEENRDTILSMFLSLNGSPR